MLLGFVQMKVVSFGLSGATSPCPVFGIFLFYLLIFNISGPTVEAQGRRCKKPWVRCKSSENKTFFFQF